MATFESWEAVLMAKQYPEIAFQEKMETYNPEDFKEHQHNLIQNKP
jgi:hypothetical protein